MVVLIWFLCCLGYGLAVTILAEFGVQLGFVPTVLLFLGTFYLARTFVGKWKEKRRIISNRTYETLKQTTPSQIIDHCGKILSDKQELRSYLTLCSNEGKISKQQADTLYHYFTIQIKY